MKITTKAGSGNALSASEREDIWEILKLCDAEFYPPLSERNSSCQKDFAAGAENAAASGAESAGDGPRAYFEEMIRQEFLLAYDGDEMAGFMTFKKEYRYEKLGEEWNPSLYMTTACVRPVYRDHGSMNAL